MPYTPIRGVDHKIKASTAEGLPERLDSRSVASCIETTQWTRWSEILTVTCLKAKVVNVQQKTWKMLGSESGNMRKLRNVHEPQIHPIKNN